MKAQNLVGKKFGRLTVIERAENGKHGDSRWLCLCECGNSKVILGSHLKRGKIRSCGCFQKEFLEKCRTKHGKRHTKLYGIWAGIKRRCYNKNEKTYKHYGGRGIKMCDEWLNNFEEFYKWAMENGYSDKANKYQCTIDRINNNDDYKPSNCRWVDQKKQNSNKRTNRIFEYNNQKKCLTEWSEITGISKSTIYRRLNKGWNIEKILSTPTLKTKHRS